MEQSLSNQPSTPSLPSSPVARVWAWDKSLEAGALAKTEKSAPSSFISLFCGTSEWQVSPRASIAIRSTQKASHGCTLTLSVADSETGQMFSLHGTEVLVDIVGGWPVLIVSE